MRQFLLVHKSGREDLRFASDPTVPMRSRVSCAICGICAKRSINTRRLALGAILVYQLALLYRFQNGLDLNIGLEVFLKAA